MPKADDPPAAPPLGGERSTPSTRLVRVGVARIGDGSVPLPTRHSAEAAGLDLCAAVTEALVLEPGARHLVGTGFAMAIPPGYEGQVRPRSGLALHHGVTVLNAPGTVDADYRGEVKVLLVNHGREPYRIEPGARIAQLVIAPVTPVSLELVPRLDDTARGSGGYGSTGR